MDKDIATYCQKKDDTFEGEKKKKIVSSIVEKKAVGKLSIKKKHIK